MQTALLLAQRSRWIPGYSGKGGETGGRTQEEAVGGRDRLEVKSGGGPPSHELEVEGQRLRGLRGRVVRLGQLCRLGHRNPQSGLLLDSTSPPRYDSPHLP